MYVAPVAGAGDDFEMWEMLGHRFGGPHRCFDIVNGEDKNFRMLGPGRTQDIKPRRIAVVDNTAISPHHVNLRGVYFQCSERTIDNSQQASNDLSDAAETGMRDSPAGTVPQSSCPVSPLPPAVSL